MASASAPWCPVGRVESDLGMPGQRHNGLKVPVLAKLLRILWLRLSRNADPKLSKRDWSVLRVSLCGHTGPQHPWVQSSSKNCGLVGDFSSGQSLESSTNTLDKRLARRNW